MSYSKLVIAALAVASMTVACSKHAAKEVGGKPAGEAGTLKPTGDLGDPKAPVVFTPATATESASLTLRLLDGETVVTTYSGRVPENTGDFQVKNESSDQDYMNVSVRGQSKDLVLAVRVLMTDAGTTVAPQGFVYVRNPETGTYQLFAKQSGKELQETQKKFATELAEEKAVRETADKMLAEIKARPVAPAATPAAPETSDKKEENKPEQPAPAQPAQPAPAPEKQEQPAPAQPATEAKG